MALLTESQLLNDTTLQARVTMAILHTGNNVLYEDPATPNHDNRINLAGAAMRNPMGYERAMYNNIIIQPGIVEHGGDSSQIQDQTILDAVSAQWNAFANELFQTGTPPPV